MRTFTLQPAATAAAPRALVVGGGVAGLSAAWHLSRGGASVTVLEAASELGGRAATRFEDGFSFNLGPHALYRQGEWKRLLDDADVAYGGGRPPVGGGFGIYQGGLVGMPSSPWNIATSRFFGLRDKAQLLRFFARLPGLSADAFAGKTLAQMLDGEISSPRARSFAEGFFRVSTYANAPEKLCAAAAIRQAKRGLAGVLYVAGGWGSLIRGLAAVLRRQVVRLETGAKATRLVLENDGVRGVELAEGRRFEAELVVLAVRPQTLLRLLPEDRAARLYPQLAEAVPSAAACLDLALERLPRPEVLFALGFDQPTYYSVHSASTRLGPPGKVLLHAARYLAPGEQLRRAEAEAGLEQMMDLLQLGWRGLELRRQLLPQMVVQDSLPVAGKSRPGIGAACIEGLRLAGDWVESTALLADAAAESAARAAKELLAEAGLGQDALRRTA